MTFTANDKGEIVPRGQLSPLIYTCFAIYYFYMAISFRLYVHRSDLFVNSFYPPSRRPILITLDYSGYKKTESNNCFIINCFEKNNDKHTVALGT